MNIKSTLRVFNDSDMQPGSGVVKGQGQKHLAGGEKNPTERITVRQAIFEAGAHEQLHWHLIEAFYYIISGKAILKDIEGQEYELSSGSVIYAPPGIAGAHSWDIIENLKLLSIRATIDPEKMVSINVDASTLESKIKIDHLVFRDAIHFKKSLY